MKADVVIVGAGPAGIFTAIEMLKLGSHRKIVIVEKGQSVEKRHCPKSLTSMSRVSEIPRRSKRYASAPFRQVLSWLTALSVTWAPKRLRIYIFR